MKIAPRIAGILAATILAGSTTIALAAPSHATVADDARSTTATIVATDKPGEGVVITRNLSINVQRQEQSNWCWAAVGTSLARFHGRSVSQLVFCNRANDLPDTNKECPNHPGSLHDVNRVLATMNLPGSVYGQLSLETIKEEIDAGRPIIIGISYNQGGGHAQIISGYNTATSQIYVRDPRGDLGWVLHSSYVQNNDFNWSQSLVGVG